MNDVIESFRNLLVAATLVIGACVATGINAQEPVDRSGDEKSKPADKSADKKSKPQGSGDISAPVLMLVPIEISTGMEERGCWVKLYDREGFRGDSITLMGPLNMPVMIGPFGANWENKVRSVKTGPTANVTIFDNRNFQDQSKFIGVNAFVPDMSERMGFFDDFRSMMLNCT